jgi:hypothetical protein
MKMLKSMILGATMAAALAFTAHPLPGQTGGSKTKTDATKTASTPAPTDKEIADAKAKGLVWVNTSSKIYHKDGEFYGKTKQGKFMTEADAQKAGYRAAKPSGIGKKKSTDAKK